MAGPPRTREPSLRKRLLLLTTSVLCALLITEIGLRLLWTPWAIRSQQLFEASAAYGWSPKPGITGTHATPEYTHQATHNAQGWRGDREFAGEKAAGMRARVLFLGDSFTYGLGSADHETFVARFDRSLPDVEVVNAGVNGLSTRECVAILDHLGAALSPDLAVYMFFWNDLDDNLARTAPEFLVNEGTGHLVRKDRTSPSTDPLALRPKAEVGDTSPWSRPYLAELVVEGLKGLRYRLFGIKQRVVHTPALKAQAWEKTEALIQAMQVRSKEIGSKLVIVCIPDHNQIDAEAVIKNIEPLNYEVQAELAAICTGFGIPYVDLLPGLKQSWEQAGEDFYYYADRHLTPRGNQAVAELLLERLVPMLPEK